MSGHPFESWTYVENDARVTSDRWPMHVGSLLLRDPLAADIEHMLVLRSDPVVNRFMLLTSADPETFRKEWLAVPTSGSVSLVAFVALLFAMG